MKSQYDVDRMTFSNLENTVIVPSYQRRLVWSDKQKRSFIENISRGFPFGSILLYRYDNKKELSLIDGLQRFSTLREYKASPSKYFTKLEPYVGRILELIEKDYGIELTESQRKELTNQIEPLLSDCLSETKPTPYRLRNLLREKISMHPNKSDSEDALIDLQADLFNAADNYLDLDNLVIPCVVFTGGEDQLPDVFANLNQGGTKLSKYQVLAAHWHRYDFKLPETDIGNVLLDKVISRYQKLEETRDLEIDNFDPDEMEQTRKINLSEYCFALGELIAEKVDVFWQSAVQSESDKSEDTFNVLGYLSAAIALDVDNRAINKLHERIDLFHSDIFVDRLTNYILKEYSVIQSEFKRWLRKPGIEDTYESGAVTDMQVLSFFAALWHKHYYIDYEAVEIKVIENYRTHGYETTRKNLVASCILDVVTRKWQGSGDSRLANFYVESAEASHDYAVPMSKELLTSSLETWYREISQRGSVNIEKVSKMLLCVYTAPDITSYTAEKYDIEHVISKNKLKNKNIYVNEQIPGGTLGNLMYLSPKTNRGKKDNNLYILRENHEGVAFDDEYLAKIDYPPSDSIFRAEKELESGESEEANKLIRDRTSAMIKKIVNAVCNY